MASGSVTRRFLFSTNFLSLEHLWDSDAGDRPAQGDHTSVFPLGDTADLVVCSSPAQALRDELQVVVGCHELLKVGELADA